MKICGYVYYLTTEIQLSPVHIMLLLWVMHIDRFDHRRL